MIEQSVSLASNGVVKVPGYEQMVRFGYTKNRGKAVIAILSERRKNVIKNPTFKFFCTRESATNDKSINIALWNEFHFLFATFCKDSAFHRPLAVLRNSICGANVPKSLCHVRSTEKNLSIFFNRAKLAKGLVLENVKCVTSLVIHHILHIQLFGIFHAGFIRLVSDSR